MYLGDSASLSYLHMFRFIVEHISGASAFTDDPNKESIVEQIVDLPPNIKPPCILPDHRTAEVLVESFFVNVFAALLLPPRVTRPDWR